MGESREVCVIALDDVLIRALNQHSSGWRAVAYDKEPASDALVIVDLDDPAERGEAVAALHATGFAGPILMLGERDGPGNGVEPVARPVRLGVLLARIEAHRSEADGSEVHQLGPYSFVPGEQLLRDPKSDAVIRLTELERNLLLYLAAAKGASVDREQLLAHVWGYSAGVDTHTVETHIWRLRQKIETEDPASRFLVTEAGKYRLLLARPDQAG